MKTEKAYHAYPEDVEVVTITEYKIESKCPYCGKRFNSTDTEGRPESQFCDWCDNWFDIVYDLSD